MFSAHQYDELVSKFLDDYAEIECRIIHIDTPKFFRYTLYHYVLKKLQKKKKLFNMQQESSNANDFYNVALK